MTTQHLLQHICEQKIIITATFTGELIEDSLSYWLQEIGIPSSIEFAPYNQVFQELLNPASLLANNKNGVNVVLVRFEDWEGTKNSLQLVIDSDQKEQNLGDRSRYTLPNHLEIAHLNQYETEYLYQEIFVDRVYLKHGIIFNDDDCIVDVGANIGLFTLFAQQKCPQGTFYAFEPAPHAFDKLQTNAKLYCQNAHLFNCGLGSHNREETFTFYPRSSVFSCFAADTEQDEKAIHSVILNILRRDSSLDEQSLLALADEFVKDRLERKTYQVKLQTLSEIIEEYNIQKIDLLKLDAQKSELAILQGIKKNHWSLIKQIVIEVHDSEGNTIRQVMRLLEEKGFYLTVDEKTLLQGSGLFNIYATRPQQKSNSVSQQVEQNTAQIEQNVRDFANALKTSVTRRLNPHFVFICPPSPKVDPPGYNLLHQKMEDLLETELAGISGVYLTKSTELISTYPVQDYYDPYGDELGHIPYTAAAFCALGTMVARKIFALKSSPYKVIALDCDYTLWSGVCGEDGITGVKIDSPFRALQEFIVRQQAAGKLICLCSKNQQEDVFAVFDQHPDMLLKRHHLVNWRINWQSKSENLKFLATELQLGLDSFIFIDDNPVECAEVRANCPEVLTLQLPQECDGQSPAKGERIPQFLQHIWAFDQLQTTQEDQQRTNLYQQNVQRQRLQQDSLSFADFLAQLNLEIEISPMQPEQLSRVAQLTARTNQFNLTTIRRSEAEIEQLCNSGKLECRVVKVKDRFGDYGLVGLLLFKAQENALFVDTFLLSCRVLGRGVEHNMLAYLGTLAQERELEQVEVFYTPTQKNKPAWNFLISVGRQFQQEKDGGWLFKFPSQTASESNFMLIIDRNTAAKNVDESLAFASNNLISDINTVVNQPNREAKSISDSSVKIASNADFFEHIARNLYSPELILNEIASRQQRRRPQLDIEFVSPRNAVELQLVQIWSKILKVDNVGIKDNFFDLGGHSILAAYLMGHIKQQFGKDIPITILFQHSTIEQLASVLQKDTNASGWFPLVAIQPIGSNPPFFCLPGAGGFPFYLHTLARCLGSDQPFYSFQAQPWDGELAPVSKVEDRAAQYIQAIRTVQPQGPYFLGGHSFGAKVVFEMAQQLMRQGEVVALVAIFDTIAPIVLPEQEEVDDTTWLLEIAKLFQTALTKDVAINPDTLLSLALEEQFEYVLDCLKMVDIMPPDADTRYLKQFLQASKADIRSSVQYVPQQVNPTAITLFRAREFEFDVEEATALKPELSEFFQVLQDLTWGWSAFSNEPVDIQFVPGNHVTIMTQPHVQVLAERLNACIKQALKKMALRDIETK